VVDYKFGETESKVHTQQVQQYMSLIRQMGYQVTGFLCYVSIAKVIEVELS
jgi:CRISPR/Cas system-associated exonuclease Cas4 (RecB family)